MVHVSVSSLDNYFLNKETLVCKLYLRKSDLGKKRKKKLDFNQVTKQFHKTNWKDTIHPRTSWFSPALPMWKSPVSQCHPSNLTNPSNITSSCLLHSISKIPHTVLERYYIYLFCFLIRFLLSFPVVRGERWGGSVPQIRRSERESGLSVKHTLCHFASIRSPSLYTVHIPLTDGQWAPEGVPLCRQGLSNRTSTYIDLHLKTE